MSMERKIIVKNKMTKKDRITKTNALKTYN